MDGRQRRGLLTGLAETEHDDLVLVEMETLAAERDFPIVGRATGRYLELAARMVGARRVMELGSGYGYSAYWFARAVGPGGEVICTDGSADNAAKAELYLSKAGVWDRVRYRVGDALTGFAAEEGEFDIVYRDVDKLGYPDRWMPPASASGSADSGCATTSSGADTWRPGPIARAWRARRMPFGRITPWWPRTTGTSAASS